MDARTCPYCGRPNPPTSRFCGACGRPVAAEPTAREADPWFLGRYSGLRFQVDPGDPPPYRDARWVLVVLGVGLATLGAFLLALDSLLTGALSLSGGSCSGCSAAPVAFLFLFPGLGLLLAGAVVAGAALVHALRTRPTNSS
ncbi:MAG TPA: zinc ribbon domain-containing protein [Thermoplasmata archaeon]|nr:zinc ribbon domain-containing protein [Thermoplasmata archaeon]